LWCARGKHYIGNEPYTFIGEGAIDEHQPVCLRCLQSFHEEVERVLEDVTTFLGEDKKQREARRREWELLPESEKRARLETNLSTWATEGDDGIWRRKDNSAVVELNEDGTLVRGGKAT
jgi:hypothetical protein